MVQIFLIYIFFLFFGTAVSVFLILRLGRYRASPGAYGLMTSIACSAEWSFAYAMEIYTTDLGVKIFWAKLEFLGIAFIGLGLFIFSLQFTGRGNWLTRPRLAALIAPGIITVILALTNEYHRQIWSEISLRNGSLFGPLDLSHGLWFYLDSAFTYVLLLLSAVFLLEIARQRHGLFRNQARTMLVGLLLPWIANFIYIGGFNPLPGIDLTPIALTLTNLAVTIGFFQFHFMDLQPIAHSSVFYAMSNAVMVVDRNNRIVDINTAGSQIFGDRPHLVGAGIDEIFPEWRGWNEMVPPAASHQLALKVNGGQRIYNLQISPLSDSNGKNSGQIIILNDITDENRAHEEARRANQSKTKLLANVSHDLRTPLGAIIGYAEMLQDGSFGSVNEEQQNAAYEILDSSNQLMGFVNNLVGQAQIETGRVILHEHNFEPYELISPLLSTLKFHAQKKGLTLEVEFDPQLPEELIGDAYWLRQIVLNLINNSVKFTEKGSVKVRFCRKDMEHWAIQVSDTGIGIPEEAQSSIFEEYSQVDNKSTRKQAGSGLGLSIVKGLANEMGGRIDLISKVGEGSTFTVVLPLIAAQKN